MHWYCILVPEISCVAAKSPEPEVVVSSSEEDVETEVETEVEVEEEEPFNICTSMVGHMVASPPEDFEPKMVKKTVKKMVKRTVRRKKGWKTKKMTGISHRTF